MKNINLIFSPKKLQTSPGSPQIMSNTTMKWGKSFLFRLLSDLRQFEMFCIISIQTLKCCRCHYYAYSLIYAQLSTLAWAACAYNASGLPVENFVTRDHSQYRKQLSLRAQNRLGYPGSTQSSSRYNCLAGPTVRAGDSSVQFLVLRSIQ